ncbi:methyltransferase domain-containing protein [Saccharothrix obliqua]|uniref:methyltransferase domain-containing protein n=1 Tax=Saccharothrix obliqua TaxID=2861747 RepID=UPI001C5E8D7D|nr:methyltransferase domain-containing protein [Saccharothrix obliqua]MBW4718725.1 methyltransferase domain-containing protein [Saccharothrix obliqua]
MTTDSAFIRATYEQLAQLGESGLCCSPVELYRPDELASIPEDVLRLSSGCGHPLDDVVVEPGSTVLDIGSGAGADCLLAARRVGRNGVVIGVDPSSSMRAVASRHAEEVGLGWIDYREGTADDLPCADDSVDLAISNCVLSLSADPAATWTEIARVLAPGGRVAMSDIIGGTDPGLDAKARCETGLEWSQYRDLLRANGFSGIRPIRIRRARFRDGARAASVTFHARHGMPIGHADVQVLYRQSHRAEAERLVIGLGELVSAHRLPLGIRLADIDEPDHTAVARLVLDAAGLPFTTPLAVSVDAAVVPADDLTDVLVPGR